MHLEFSFLFQRYSAFTHILSMCSCMHTGMWYHQYSLNLYSLSCFISGWFWYDLQWERQDWNSRTGEIHTQYMYMVLVDLVFIIYLLSFNGLFSLNKLKKQLWSLIWMAYLSLVEMTQTQMLAFLLKTLGVVQVNFVDRIIKFLRGNFSWRSALPSFIFSFFLLIELYFFYAFNVTDGSVNLVKFRNLLCDHQNKNWLFSNQWFV